MSQSAKDAERKRIEAATAAFLANGGTITHGIYTPDEYGGKPEYEVVKKAEKREKGQQAPGWKGKGKQDHIFSQMTRADIEQDKARKARRKARAEARARQKAQAKQEAQQQEKAA